MKYLAVFITASNKHEAEKIAEAMLDKRVIACANLINGVDSRFWWQGRKERSRECLIICKTTSRLFSKIIKIVKTNHSYKVPEIIAIPIETGYKHYLNWIKEAVS